MKYSIAIKNFLKHPIISGSAVIIIGTNIGNVFNLFFNFFMLWKLSSIDYGTLISLISVITLFALVAESFSPVIVNFAAIHFAKKELSTVKSLFFSITKVSSIVGFVILGFFVVFSSKIGQFLNIRDPYLVIVTGICIFFSFIGVINRALLQAKLAFLFISFITLFGSFLKLSFGSLLVIMGFRVYGAIFAFFLAFIFPYLISFTQLKFLLSKETYEENIELKKIINFGLPSALAMFGLTSFITSDILLVKHFFDPKSAGLYAGLAVVGKIIFYFSAPIGTVMFPLIVQKYAKKENYHNDFRLALFVVLIPSLILTILYFSYPEFIITFVMRRDEYLKGASILGLFSACMTIYSILTIVTNFYISIQITKIYIPIIIFAVIQVLLIWFYHESLLQVIAISFSVLCLLLLVLLVYYWKVISSKNIRFNKKNIV